MTRDYEREEADWLEEANNLEVALKELEKLQGFIASGGFNPGTPADRKLHRMIKFWRLVIEALQRSGLGEENRHGED